MDSIAEYCSQKDEIKALKTEIKKLKVNIASANYRNRQGSENKRANYADIAFMLGTKAKHLVICATLKTSSQTITKVKKLLTV